MKTHIQIVALLYIAFGGMFAVVALASLLLFGGLGIASGEAQAFRILGVFGTVGFLFMGTLAAPGIVVGVALLKKVSWALVVGNVLAVLLLFAVPIGTLIGLYALWVLNDAGTRTIFAGAATLEAD